MNPKDPKVITHQGVDISLESTTGRFYCRPKGRDTDLFDKTLDGLKKKVDNLLRASARAQAVNLSATVLQLETGWRNEDTRATWLVGTFLGINAHTAEVSFKKLTGEPVHLSGSAYFFRSDDPAIPKIQELLKDRIAKEKVARLAREAADELLERHGHRPQLGRARTGGKSEEAAKAEQLLIDVLAPVPAAKVAQ